MKAGKGYTFLKAWSKGWVRCLWHISELYRQTDERLTLRKAQADFSAEQAALYTMITLFADQIDEELASTTLHRLQRKILRSVRQAIPGLFSEVEM